MMMFPFLSLSDIAIDEQVARRLPRHLAYFHRALPIAEDGEAITVVMAHPYNRAVISVLETILDAPVVPVRGDEREIQAVLTRLFPAEESSARLRFLTYGNEPFAASLAELLGAALTTIEREGSLDAIVTLANSGHYDLTIMAMPEIAQLGGVLRHLSTSLLLLPPAPENTPQSPLALRRVLCLLRGHAPDDLMLDWVIRLAKGNGALLSLLAVAGSQEFRTPGFSRLLTPQHPAGEHIAACVRAVAESGVQGTLKLRQGNALQQIGREINESGCDMLAIAAEAYGDFVQRLLSDMCQSFHGEARDQSVADCTLSILVVRPI